MIVITNRLEFWVLLCSWPVSFGEAEMKAGLVAIADTREALSQSASIVIQNLEATLANKHISLLQGHFFFFAWVVTL